MSLLIITLPLAGADNSVLFDYVLSPEGRTVDSHASVPLALLPSQRQTEVVAVVRAQALSWHQVQLPQGSLQRSLFGERGATRLRAILDGLLEDQLLDEPVHMHLALEPNPNAAGGVWVAACNRAWLTAMLASLAAAGHEVTRIVPEFTPQALREATYITGEPDHAKLAGLLVQDTSSGEAGPAGVLVCGMSATSVALLAPALAELRCEPAVAEQAEQSFGRPVTLLPLSQRMLLAAQSPWDLAQFDLTNASRDRRWVRLSQGVRSFLGAPQWRAARLALVVLVMVQLVGLNAWALREQSALKAQRQAIRAVLAETFPKIPVIVDAPLQMAREVAALQRSSGSAAGTDLESMLSSFSAVAKTEYAPIAIDFAAGELRLSGPALSVQEQTQITAALKSQGLAASAQGEQWLIRAGVTP
jgi:general secretion pathway protein L